MLFEGDQHRRGIGFNGCDIETAVRFHLVQIGFQAGEAFGK
jgi:hypothetical protein